MSLAVSYRPKVIEDLVGQEVPAKIIRNLLKRYSASGCNYDVLPNSIIICGPYGSGKTTSARILARYLNCEKGPLEACGVCQSCVDIDHDRSRALIEVDAASNRGIASIDQIKDRTNYKSGGRVLVVVLDEVHMLSKEAWTALLKVLEESSQKVMWIMCTTDASKVLDTIKSRSTVLQVNTVAPDLAAARILAVAAAEGITLDEESARTIGFLSKGHMRDCLQLLETASVLSGTNVVSLTDVYQAANLSDVETTSKLINAFYSGDIPSLHLFIQQYLDNPATLFNSAILSVHQSISQVTANDPITLADKILFIELITQARREFNDHGFSFPFIQHYFNQFQDKRVKVG